GEPPMGPRPPQNMGGPPGMKRGGKVHFDDGGETDFPEMPYLDEMQLRNMAAPDLITYFARKHNFDPRIPLAIAGNATPNFDPNAVYPKGAGGIMQLMPGTAKEMGVRDIFDPVQNTEAGVKYAKKMYNQFGGDIPLTLAAYNAGPGNVKKYGGVPPFKETKKYV